VRFCTISNAAQLPQARVLARALREHHPDGGLSVLRLGSGDAIANDPFETVWPQELWPGGLEGLPAAGRWADQTEFLKPQLLVRMLERGGGEGDEAIVYLDVAVDLRAPLDPVRSALERNRAVLAPRLLGRLPEDGRRPGVAELRRAGRLGASLVALRGVEGLELARWWAGRVARAASAPLASQAAQSPYARRELSRWLEIAPSVFAGVATLSDPGSAVGYWNLHERSLARAGERVLVDGRPLRFLHLEGFDPGRPFLLSPDADRVRMADDPLLAELVESYAQRLREAGWRDTRRRADVGRPLPNGFTFDNRLSLLLADAAAAGEDFGDVFTDDGCDAFMRWLEGPAPHGAAFGINRYLYRVYGERADLAVAYPFLDGPDGSGYAGWVLVFGVVEMEIPERFLPPAPPGLGSVRPRAAEPRRQVPALPRGRRPELSVHVSGLFAGTLGLGEAARGYVRALETASIPVSTSTVDVREFVQLAADPHEDYARVSYTDVDGAAADGFRLICLNADELPRFAERVGESFFEERPAIGVWAWETDQIPERWKGSFELLDEIWVYTDYVAGNLARAASIPVRRVPPPVLRPEPGDVRLELGVPGGFQFLFMFDFFSTIQRKNPVGLIEAFKLAFAPGEGPQLVVKTINGVHRPHALEEVLWAARDRPDVHVVDRSLDARERDALVAGCDCYVSLHRSEGFGLTLAECMALGKPVIATAFSGPADFMTEENSYPVPFELTRVGADCEIYPADGTWADPDLRRAAELMRQVVENPREAAEKGARAMKDVERMYSPAAIGELIRARLEELRALWPERARVLSRSR
jgi:glycosyltransferase involved in cell wall biosynthesis